MDCQETLNDNKRKEEITNTILASVQTEMALPRMSKSARIAKRHFDTSRAPEQPRTFMPGTAPKPIRSPRPGQAEKAQVSIDGDDGYRELRI